MVRILILFIIFGAFSCGNSILAEDDFDLFKNTELEKFADLTRIEDTIGMSSIFNSNRVNLELKETKYGNTILSLAVQNSKVNSVQKILELGANPNCVNKQGNAPIHELQFSNGTKKEVFQICKSLIEYKADVNKVSYEILGKDTVSRRVPLEGLSRFLETAKLLYLFGADLYANYDGNYPIWHFKKIRRDDETIDFVYWLIVEQKVQPPKVIGFTSPGNKPIDFRIILDQLRQGATGDEIRKIKVIEQVLHLS